jgi:hypothetical protein
MIRSKCPKCGKALSFPESPGATIRSCPDCGQMFRVPAQAVQTGPPKRPRRGASANPDNADDELVEIIDEEQPEEEEEHADDEASRPRKRKKKKQKRAEAGSMSFLHIALIVGGLSVVVIATIIFFIIQHGNPRKAKSEMEEGLVLAELEDLKARVKRDTDSPDQPVIEVDLSGTDFKPQILSKLKAFPQLRKLNLAATPTTDMGLEWLEDVTSLTVLDLGHTKVTGGGMQHLRKMVNLEELNLNQTLVDDFRLTEALKGCKKLKRIFLDGTLASGAGLQAAIPGLEVNR